MASHVMKYEEFSGGSDIWYCTDTKDFKQGSGLWWHPARMLGISLTDFITMLVEEYGVTKLAYNKDRDVLIYGWKTQAAAHKFVLFINREARKRNYTIGK